MLQSSFSIKELKELVKLDSMRYVVVEEELRRSLNEASLTEISDSARESHLHQARLLKKKLQVFQGNQFLHVKENDLESLMQDKDPKGRKNIIFRFLAHPISSTRDDNGKIKSIECERTKLEGPVYKQRAVPDHSLPKFNLKADLAVTAIGYYSLPLPGIGNFDQHSHILPNSHGCVLEAKDSDKFRLGVYCAGWVKTGAKGIIDTTMKGAEETYNNLKNHVLAGKLEQKEDPKPALDALKSKLGKRTTDFEDWLKLDQVERDLGEKMGKVRHKLATNEEILQHLAI